MAMHAHGDAPVGLTIVLRAQVKRVLQWLLRIFFAATIGFEIPIRDFFSAEVLGARAKPGRRLEARVGCCVGGAI